MKTANLSRRHTISDLAPIFLGVALGLSLYLANEIFDNLDTSIHTALLAFFWVTPIVAMFIVEPRSVIRDIGLAALVGLTLSLLSYIYIQDVGDIDNGGILFLMLFIVGACATTFIQSSRIDRRFIPPIPSWQRYAWDNILTVGLSMLFVGAGWLVLFLWGALFKLINIDFFEELFTDTEWFQYLFWGTMFGAGVWLARGRPQIVQSVGRLFGVLFRTLTPVLAFVSLMFLVTLPFVGLQPLWDTKSATGILLSLVFTLALGTAGAALVREQKAKVSLFENWVIRAGLLAVPVLTALAAYALWLRIDQYGLTPERIYVAAIILFASLISLVGALAALALGRDWLVAIDRSLPPIALVTALIAVGLHLPPLEPFGWSVNNQVARLNAGEVAAKDFDFGLLKFRLGDQGRVALATLRQNSDFTSDPEVQELLAALDEADNYWQWTGGRPVAINPDVDLNDMSTYMIVHPTEHAVPTALGQIMADHNYNPKQSCATNFASGSPTCHLYFTDLNGDGIVDAFLWMQTWELLTFLQDQSGQWHVAPRLMMDGDNFDFEELSRALESGNVQLAEPKTKAVIVGDVRFE